MTLNAIVAAVTDKIRVRSKERRPAHLARLADTGRELFAALRRLAGRADEGAPAFGGS